MWFSMTLACVKRKVRQHCSLALPLCSMTFSVHGKGEEESEEVHERRRVEFASRTARTFYTDSETHYTCGCFKALAWDKMKARKRCSLALSLSSRMTLRV